MRNKEQSTEQSTEQSSVQSTEQSPVQSTEQPSSQSMVRSNDTKVYGVSKIAVLANGVFEFFPYNTYLPKELLLIEKQDQQPKRRPML